MSDRKKMINELTYQINSNEVMRQHYPVQLSVTDARKILALLKEQEPVKPIRLENWWRCPSCSGNIVANMKYCPGCGSEVKWDE